MGRVLWAGLWLVVGLLLVGVVGCGGIGGGDDSDLPRVAGTFACQVDGVVFPTRYQWFARNGGQLNIVGFTADERRQVWLQVAAPVVAAAAVPTVIPLGGPGNQDRGQYVKHADPDADPPGDHFFTDETHTGTLTINTLTEERCTGTFEFLATNGTATVNVTSGTFDVGYADYSE